MWDILIINKYIWHNQNPSIFAKKQCLLCMADISKLWEQQGS